MAERYIGRVIRMTVADFDDSLKRRMLELLLDEMPGVNAYALDDATRTLTAYIDDTDADEASIARALEATGMYPLGSTLLGGRTEGEMNVC